MSSPPRRTCRVLLLKAADDAYAAAFTQQQHVSSIAFEPHFADVLTFEFINTQALHDAIVHIERYSAVLVTSPRGARAITDAVQALQQLDANAYNRALTALRALTIYSVGRATSRELDALGVTCVGDHCGSADALAAFLTQQDDATDPHSNNSSKPVLFACGEKHSNVLPACFGARGVALDELVVYRSCAVADIVLPPAISQESRLHWIVFFSPSGLHALLRSNNKLLSDLTTVHKAAIGNTTARALADKAVATSDAHWQTDVVAAAPTAVALVEAICAFEAAAADMDNGAQC